jgi:hypothetical protein
MNIIMSARAVACRSSFLSGWPAESVGFHREALDNAIINLRREIAPMALAVPASCLDGGMQAAVAAYRAGLAALEGDVSR